jgi:ATP-binding cassette subfamily C protein
MKIIIFIKKYILKYKAETVGYIFLGLLLWALSILGPYIVGGYIDSLVNSSDSRVIWQAVSTLAVIWTLQLVFSYVRNVISAKLNSLEDIEPVMP